ncbi:heterokaryon incompatibility protein Het-C protein [Ceratobasidium sp. AG-Ba]|nr:heterokaryon incompatibility protein Het-C protein [Ceratobasidium sp. AG-Ba]
MSFLVTTLLVTVLLCVLVPHVAAFGAGDIPDYAYLNDKAFRHGDLESILSTLSKNVPAGLGGGVGGILAGVAKMALRGGHDPALRKEQGNWLRDYSQAMDIAGLSKMTAQTLITVVSALGFMTFGFATEEFEVTADRLGVYLPVEHIDKCVAPKDMPRRRGDARQFHPKLRPPVDPRELEIDQNTGMKNYIATEGQSWDTSTAHVRRTLQACIEHGRLASGNEGGYMWEAFRLLGTALHTLEDLLAHSNWCELGLLKMGHNEVFCHVGDNVKVNTPNGQAPPLITGTFGSADFMHSLLGEATDHLSEASMKNQNQSESPISKLRAVLGRIPSGGGDDKQNAMNQGDEIRNKAFNFNPDDVAPEDVQRQFLEILKWHDQVMHDITKTIQNIPGLESLLEDLTNAMNAYVYTTLEPWLTPILQQATGALQEGSAAVIDTDDQYEVFNNPDASDPSHSLLSKDHFGLILNEPAGKVALVVVKHTVELIVQAWYDESKDVGQTINQVMEAFHHPFYATGNSQVQNNMAEELKRWFDELGSEARLSFQRVFAKERTSAWDKTPVQPIPEVLAVILAATDNSNPVATVNRATDSSLMEIKSSTYGSGGGYGSSRNEGESGTVVRDMETPTTMIIRIRGGTYGQSTNEYGGSGRTGYGNEEDNSYSSRRNQGSYGQTEESYGSRREESHSGYNPSYNTSESTYSSRREEESSYGRNNDSYGSRGNDEYGAVMVHAERRALMANLTAEAKNVRMGVEKRTATEGGIRVVTMTRSARGTTGAISETTTTKDMVATKATIPNTRPPRGTCWRRPERLN